MLGQIVEHVQGGAFSASVMFGCMFVKNTSDSEWIGAYNTHGLVQRLFFPCWDGALSNGSTCGSMHCCFLRQREIGNYNGAYRV